MRVEGGRKSVSGDAKWSEMEMEGSQSALCYAPSIVMLLPLLLSLHNKAVQHSTYRVQYVPKAPLG